MKGPCNCLACVEKRRTRRNLERYRRVAHALRKRLLVLTTCEFCNCDDCTTCRLRYRSDPAD